MVVELFNSSLEFGRLFDQMTVNFTGDIFLTLMFVLAFFILVALMFRTPIMLAFIVILPLIVVFSDYDYTGGFYTVLAVIAIILGVMMARTIFAYR